MRLSLSVSVVLLGALGLITPAVAAPACQRSCPKGVKKDKRGCCVKGKSKKSGIKTKRKVQKKKPVSRDAKIKWITLPGGRFQMGSASGDADQRPVHEVTVARFKIAKHEVTVKQYAACVNAGVCTEPNKGSGCNWGRAGREDFPVNCVDWHQAKAFSAWVGGRLPTEAEWEYAARSAGKEWAHPWGNANPTCTRAIIKSGGDGCGKRKAAKVCSKKGGISQQGVCDLIGNVEEWVADGYRRDYTGAPTDGASAVSGGRHKVKRGGSWISGGDGLKATTRKKAGPMLRLNQTGFRPAR